MGRLSTGLNPEKDETKSFLRALGDKSDGMRTYSSNTPRLLLLGS
jgi:hypothetical protein